jgi:hypothetical protein
MHGLVTDSILVTNTGTIAGDVSVLLFVVPPNAGQGATSASPHCSCCCSCMCAASVSDGNPIKYLAGFQRINLGPGQSETVNFNLSAVTFAVADADGQRIF